VTDFETSYARHARAGEAIRQRAEDEMAGRTVWCVSGTASSREAALRLHDLLRGLRTQGISARRRRLSALGREEDPYERADREGDALLGDRVAPEDVVILHDVEAAPLAEVARERGAHVIWLAGIERARLAMPAAGTTEIEPRGEADWARILAGIVHDDSEETVGGTLHARPAVPAR
jgi:hypothetical protein